jgi:molecular chaperone GrpE
MLMRARAQHQLLTSMADLQNLQKRKDGDVKQAREFAIQNFAKDIVSDLDVLALALSSVPVEQRTAEGPVKTLYDGVTLTAGTLERTLKRHGVVAFDPTGEVFDPNEHEAMFQAPVRRTAHGRHRPD